MSNKTLSILIPSRHEEFLARTIQDILENSDEQTEIIAVLDGEWSNPPVEQHDRVNVIYVPESIGQRAATNLACKLSKAKYVAKCDAHCAFDKGFDRKMIDAFKEVGDNVVMIPVMRNLWAFNWKCGHCDHTWYQDKKHDVCPKCGKEDKVEREIVWEPKRNIRSTSYCFDSTPTFKYFEDWKHREPYISDKKNKGRTETMSLQGSFFMCTREMYWDLGLCDETLGSWGHQGIEVSLKAHLSGGKVLVNHNTFYAHMFRTKAGTFGFPWPVSGRAQRDTKKRVKDLFWDNKWDKAIHPVSWLVEKFWPVYGWDEADLKALKEHEKLHKKKETF